MTQERSAVLLVAGSLSVRSHGYRNVERSSSATTRRQRTTRASSSLPARCFGVGGYTDWSGGRGFRIVT